MAQDQDIELFWRIGDQFLALAGGAELASLASMALTVVMARADRIKSNAVHCFSGGLAPLVSFPMICIDDQAHKLNNKPIK